MHTHRPHPPRMHTTHTKVALRRNVEAQMSRLAPGGGKGVGALLRAVSAGRELSQEQQRVLLQMRVLLKHVLEEEEIDGFLRELARGRFHLPLADGVC